MYQYSYYSRAGGVIGAEPPIHRRISTRLPDPGTVRSARPGTVQPARRSECPRERRKRISPERGKARTRLLPAAPPHPFVSSGTARRSEWRGYSRSDESRKTDARSVLVVVLCTSRQTSQNVSRTLATSFCHYSMNAIRIWLYYISYESFPLGSTAEPPSPLRSPFHPKRRGGGVAEREAEKEAHSSRPCPEGPSPSGGPLRPPTGPSEHPTTSRFAEGPLCRVTRQLPALPIGGPSRPVVPGPELTNAPLDDYRSLRPTAADSR